MLYEAPELEAKALFEHLAQSLGEEFESGLLWTFQRRVRQWRLAEGPEKEVAFTHNHAPGAMLVVAWTDMGSLGITMPGSLLWPSGSSRTSLGMPRKRLLFRHVKHKESLPFGT
jgi:hypothetical protein